MVVSIKHHTQSTKQQSTDPEIEISRNEWNEEHDIYGLDVSAVSGLQIALDGKADDEHGHAIGDTTGLQTALDGKSATNHGHAPAEITGTAVVDNDARLSDERTPTAHDNAKHSTAYASDADLDAHTGAAAPHSGHAAIDHGHAIADTTGLQTALDGKEPANANIQPHVTSAHAPSDAQKNSDITKGEIESKLTGEIATHSHAGGGGSTPDVSYWQHIGTTKYEAWYTTPRTGTALTTGAVTLGRLYAIPFLAPKAITLDRIAFNVTTLLAGYARAGIYSDASMYPNALVVDGGQMDTGTAGVKSATINQALSASSLYWLAFLASVAVTIRCFAVASLIPILGTSNSLGTAPYFGLYAAQAYGALPATFPATPTMISATPIPAIFVRLSA